MKRIIIHHCSEYACINPSSRGRRPSCAGIGGSIAGTVDSVLRSDAFVAFKAAVGAAAAAATTTDADADRVSDVSLDDLVTADDLRRAIEICYESQGTGARVLLWGASYVLRTTEWTSSPGRDVDDEEETSCSATVRDAFDGVLQLLEEKRRTQGLACSALEASVRKLAEHASSLPAREVDILDAELKRTNTITAIIETGGFTCNVALQPLQDASQEALDACLLWVRKLMETRPEIIPMEVTSVLIHQCLRVQGLAPPAPVEVVWERWRAVASSAKKAIPAFPWWTALQEGFFAYHTSGSPVRPGPGAIAHFVIPEWLMQRVLDDVTLPDTLMYRMRVMEEAVGAEAAQEIMVRLWASVPIYDGDRMGEEVWDSSIVSLANVLVKYVRDRSTDEDSPRLMRIERVRRWESIVEALIAFSTFEPPDVPLDVLSGWVHFFEALFLSLNQFGESRWSHENAASIVVGLIKVRQEAIVYCDQPSDPVLSIVVERVLKHRGVILLLIVSMKDSFVVPGISSGIWHMLMVWEDLILVCDWAMDAVLFDAGRPCLARELEAASEDLASFFSPLPDIALQAKFQDIFSHVMDEHEKVRRSLDQDSGTELSVHISEAFENFVREWRRAHPTYTEHDVLRESDALGHYWLMH